MKRKGLQDPFIQRIYHSFVFLIVIALIWGVGVKYKEWLMKSDTFQIRKIEIGGNEIFSDQEILDMGGLDLNADIWNVNLDEVRGKIGRQHFIEQDRFKILARILKLLHLRSFGKLLLISFIDRLQTFLKS